MLLSHKNLILALIAVFALAVLALSPALGALAAAVSPREEPLTELYVSDVHRGPGDVVTFAFTIHNRTNRDQTYFYVVYLETQNERTLIDSNSIEISNGGSVIVTEKVPNAPGTVLRVELPQLGQQVHVSLT